MYTDLLGGESSVNPFRDEASPKRSGNQKKDPLRRSFFYYRPFGQCCPSVSDCPASHGQKSKLFYTLLLHIAGPQSLLADSHCTAKCLNISLASHPTFSNKSLALHFKCKVISHCTERHGQIVCTGVAPWSTLAQ